MRKLLNLITIFLLVNVCQAQTRHTITATILDSANKVPLELVTVAILQVRDSSLVSYTVTDKKGVFTFYNIKDNVPLRILVSYVGYESLRLKLDFPKTDPYSLGKLYLKSRNLSEVTIKGEVAPIILKKDTIEFNAEAFKVRPNALLQDLLKKLPGMQIDRDGTLHFNGQDISKVKVDGKDFFANNYKIATQNLDADMISKVQVYDDRENDPDHLLPVNDLKKIINLKFKKEFTKSLFGKFGVGGGTQDRYNAEGTFIKTINDLQMSLIGNSNNLNGTNFTSPLFSPFQFGPRNGVQQLSTIALNVSDNFGKNVKINFTYNLEAPNNVNNTTKNVQQFLHDTTITTNSNNTSSNNNINHNLTTTIDWTPTQDDKWHFMPQIAFTNSTTNTGTQSISFNNFMPILNQDVRTDGNKGNSVHYQHLLSYYHAFKTKGESITITNNLSVYPNSSADFNNDKLTSYVAGLLSDTLNRLINNSTKNTTVSTDVSYHFPISKTLTGALTFNDLYTNSGADLFTYNQDLKTGQYDIFVQSQSSELTRNLWGESLHPQLLYRKDKINLDLGFNLLGQQINNRFGNGIADLNQNFTYLFPAISLTDGNFTIAYTENIRQPSISDLQPITVVYNQLSSFTGNPDLKPVRSHNYSMRYISFNRQNGSFKSINANVEQDGSSFTRKTTTTPQGASISTPINGPGRFTFNLNANESWQLKKIDKWQISFNSSLGAGYGHNYFLANGQPGYQDTYYGSFTQQLSVDWNDIVNIGPSYRLVPNVTKYQLVNLPTQSFFRQELNVPMRVQWPKRIIVDVNYNYIYNPQSAQGFNPKSNILSLSIARLLQQKDKGEFRLTCYDILNQSVSSSHYAEGNTINDTQFQTLKRYFMLSYSYRFNKVTTKEKR